MAGRKADDSLCTLYQAPAPVHAMHPCGFDLYLLYILCDKAPIATTVPSMAEDPILRSSSLPSAMKPCNEMAWVSPVPTTSVSWASAHGGLAVAHTSPFWLVIESVGVSSMQMTTGNCAPHENWHPCEECPAFAHPLARQGNSPSLWLYTHHFPRSPLGWLPGGAGWRAVRARRSGGTPPQTVRLSVRSTPPQAADTLTG